MMCCRLSVTLVPLTIEVLLSSSATFLTVNPSDSPSTTLITTSTVINREEYIATDLCSHLLTPDGKFHSIYTRGQLLTRHSYIINIFLWNWFDERVWSSFYLEIKLQLSYECFSKFWTIGCIELKYFKITLNWSTRFLILHRPSNLSRVITNLLLFNILSRLS